MSELMEAIVIVCETNFEWKAEVFGSKGDIYIVEWGPAPSGTRLFGYSCTCKAFEYGGGKYCKHILRVIRNGKRCAWNEEMNPDIKKSGDGKCPLCGGPTRMEGVGV